MSFITCTTAIDLLLCCLLCRPPTGAKQRIVPHDVKRARVQEAPGAPTGPVLVPVPVIATVTPRAPPKDKHAQATAATLNDTAAGEAQKRHHDIDKAREHDPNAVVSFHDSKQQARKRKRPKPQVAAPDAGDSDAELDPDDVQALMAAVHASRVRDKRLAQDLESDVGHAAAKPALDKRNGVGPSSQPSSARLAGAVAASASETASKKHKTGLPSGRAGTPAVRSGNSTEHEQALAAQRLAPGQLAGTTKAPFMPAERRREVFGGSGRLSFAQLGLSQVRLAELLLNMACRRQQGRTIYAAVSEGKYDAALLVRLHQQRAVVAAGAVRPYSCGRPCHRHSGATAGHPTIAGGQGPYDACANGHRQDHCVPSTDHTHIGSAGAARQPWRRLSRVDHHAHPRAHSSGAPARISRLCGV